MWLFGRSEQVVVAYKQDSLQRVVRGQVDVVSGGDASESDEVLSYFQSIKSMSWELGRGFDWMLPVASNYAAIASRQHGVMVRSPEKALKDAQRRAPSMLAMGFNSLLKKNQLNVMVGVAPKLYEDLCSSFFHVFRSDSSEYLFKVDFQIGPHISINDVRLGAPVLSRDLRINFAARRATQSS